MNLSPCKLSGQNTLVSERLASPNSKDPVARFLLCLVLPIFSLVFPPFFFRSISAFSAFFVFNLSCGHITGKYVCAHSDILWCIYIKLPHAVGLENPRLPLHLYQYQQQLSAEVMLMFACKHATENSQADSYLSYMFWDITFCAVSNSDSQSLIEKIPIRILIKNMHIQHLCNLSVTKQWQAFTYPSMHDDHECND